MRHPRDQHAWCCLAADSHGSLQPDGSDLDSPNLPSLPFLQLSVSRHFPAGEKFIRNGEWKVGSVPPCWGQDPYGKVLGIFGLGGIGQELARMAHAAFGMRVIYNNRCALPLPLDNDSRSRASPVIEAASGGAQWLSKDEVLAQADYISLHVPFSPATTRFLDTADFEKMKVCQTIMMSPLFPPSLPERRLHCEHSPRQGHQ